MRCQLHLVAATLISLVAAACTGGRWELMRADRLSDGVPILAVHLTDKKHGWALTPGELAKFSDQGNEWIPILSNPNGDRAFYSLVFVSPNTGFIVGAQKRSNGFTPLILQTIDGGATWQDRYVDVAPVRDIHMPHSLNAIGFCGTDVGYAVGDGLIIRTTDGGKTWDT